MNYRQSVATVARRNQGFPYYPPAQEFIALGVAGAALDRALAQIPGLPGPGQLTAQAEAAARSAAQQAGQLAIAKLEQGLGVPIPTSVKGLKKLARHEAEQLGQQALREMGLPPIPFTAPERLLTVEGAKDAAYAVGKTYIEETLKSKYGIPISLPTKLTAKEIGRSLASIVPTDVGGLIDTGLAIGAQAAASALTSVLAGTAIGSVIPGLGTVVGLAVGLAVMALKDAFTDEPPAFQRPCKNRTPCPPIPTNLTPIELIPWCAVAQQPIARALARERSMRYCGTGPIVECNAFFSTLSARAYHISKSTPQVLGLPQLARLIRLYERAPKDSEHYDTRARRVVRAKTRAGTDMLLMLPGMKRRRDMLKALVAFGLQMEKLLPRDLPRMRWALVTEMRNAALQVQNQPTRENQFWYDVLLKLFARLERAERAHREAIRVRAEQQRKRFEQRRHDPRWQRSHSKQILQFQCAEGNRQACAQLRARTA